MSDRAARRRRLRAKAAAAKRDAGQQVQAAQQLLAPKPLSLPPLPPQPRPQGSGRKPGFTEPWRWVPMQRGTRVVDPQLAELAERDPDVAAHLAEATEVWLNNLYVVTVQRYREGRPDVSSLSIRRIDRAAIHDWRHFQRIKNEIAGEDVDAFELYPMKKRTVDTANQYWIWCMRPGVELPMGFSERTVDGSNDERFPMSRQRPFGRGEKDAI